jgi:hypothetical protein
MLKSLLVCLVVLVTAPCFAHDCDLRLHDGSYQSLWRQIHQLNPEILEGGPTATEAQIYLRVKSESEKYATAEISPRFARELAASQRRHFSVENMDLKSLSNFYRNALRALVHRAAALCRRHEVTRLVEGPLTPRLQRFAEHLLDTFFSPTGLHDDALASTEAAHYFSARPWAGFNWEAAIATVASQPHKGAREIEIPRVFDWNEAHRIRIALQQDRRTGACCLSEPGCILCPHNRASLRR